MNVKQLREELTSYPDDLEILISRDEEGNGFKSLTDVGEYFVPKIELDDHEIETLLAPEDLDGEGLGEEDVETRLVLWP